jgi:hypothetical protein
MNARYRLIAVVKATIRGTNLLEASAATPQVCSDTNLLICQNAVKINFSGSDVHERQRLRGTIRRARHPRQQVLY